MFALSHVFSCPGRERRQAGSKIGGCGTPRFVAFRERPIGVLKVDAGALGAEVDGSDPFVV